MDEDKIKLTTITDIYKEIKRGKGIYVEIGNVGLQSEITHEAQAAIRHILSVMIEGKIEKERLKVDIAKTMRES